MFVLAPPASPDLQGSALAGEMRVVSITKVLQRPGHITTWTGAPALKARTLSMAIASPASVASRVMPAA